MPLTNHHKECPDCHSSDALSDYGDHTYCYSCNKYRKGNQMSTTKIQPIRPFTVGEFRPLKDRNISEATCKRYCVTVTDTKQIYPYTTKEGEHVANKIRVLPKSFTAEGTMSNNLALFGQDKFEKGAKSITIYEGELDAMSGYELTGSLYASVSVPNGATSAVNAIKHNLDYLESFEKIVLCFDNDDAGKKAIQDIVPLFSYGKVRVMKLDMKDANEYLVANRHKDFNKHWWAASTWTPNGIICSSEMLERIKNRKKVSSILYPWEGLNKFTYGIRPSELVMFTAPTGIGKTQILREISYHIHKLEPEAKIGTIYLEEQSETSSEGLMSIHANLPFHLPDTVYTDEYHTQVFNEVLSDGKFFFYDKFADNNIDSVLTRIRYYAKGLDCKYVFLDHISIIVSDGGVTDERKALDEIATKLKTLTIELNIAIIAVVHLNRQGQIRGSAGIEQLSNIVIGLDRDLKNEDEGIRNTTTLTVWKNRFSGFTGVACYLKYDKMTGRMTETTKPTVTTQWNG